MSIKHSPHAKVLVRDQRQLGFVTGCQISSVITLVMICPNARYVRYMDDAG